MEIRELTTFIHIANLNSFSKAAQKLGYSQAAVTIQIKQLENELNVRLFDRIGKQTTLTHSGEVFYEYAVSVLHDLNEVKSVLAESAELTGTLVVGTIESLCAAIFPALVLQFHQLYPKVSIRIITDSPAALLSMMNNNALDMVYLLDQRIYDAKWIKVLELPEEVVFAASTAHPFARLGSLDLDEIISQPLLLTEKDASYRLVLKQYLAANGKKLRPFLEIGNTEFIVDLLRSNAGISFLPEFTIQKDVEEGRLTSLRVKDFHMRIWRQLIYHKDKWISREMKAFIEMVQALG